MLSIAKTTLAYGIALDLLGVVQLLADGGKIGHGFIMCIVLGTIHQGLGAAGLKAPLRFGAMVAAATIAGISLVMPLLQVYRSVFGDRGVTTGNWILIAMIVMTVGYLAANGRYLSNPDAAQ